MNVYYLFWICLLVIWDEYGFGLRREPYEESNEPCAPVYVRARSSDCENSELRTLDEDATVIEPLTELILYRVVVTSVQYLLSSSGINTHLLYYVGRFVLHSGSERVVRFTASHG